MTRLAVAMSGGVDSSVAALLLRDAGASVVGLSMRLLARDGDAPAAGGRCCSAGDLLDARAAADVLGVPFYVLDMQEEFERQVVRPFVAAYRSGRTPVPCVACNTGPKFRDLLDRAATLGADRLATGHYARTERDPSTGRTRLLRARDGRRDQSYFLFDLRQDQIERAVFPVGEMTKGEVRALAAARGLPNAAKPDSQDICFVPEGRYLEVVRRQAGDAGPPGDIVTTDGRVLGRHGGLARFTVGQRRGLGIAGPRALYVVALDEPARRVIVGEEGAQYADRLTATDMNWVSIVPPRRPFEAMARIRSTHAGALATVVPDGDRVRVRFREPQRAIAPGQALVLYEGERVLGGGWIAGRPFDTFAAPMLDSARQERA